MSTSSLFRLRLNSKERLTDPSCDDVVAKLSFEALPHLSLPAFIAGQCMRLNVLEQADLPPAYFAIASSPHEKNHYDFVVKDVAPLSHALLQLEEGDEIEVEGPMGKGFDLSQDAGKHIILMGVGTGIAPLRSVWLDIIKNREKYGKVSIYAGFLTAMHHLLTDELESLAEHDVQVSISLATGHNDWHGPVGYVQHALENDKPDPDNTVVCLAGMNVMVDACSETLQQLGFDDEQVRLNF
ncbi:MAG: FAD-binding oxidoreductase [Mariprofundaceae bacterium]|nr:FAD-binding oxidoreductase [Mariprofundaceae bacterium]